MDQNCSFFCLSVILPLDKTVLNSVPVDFIHVPGSMPEGMTAAVYRFIELAVQGYDTMCLS